MSERRPPPARERAAPIALVMLTAVVLCMHRPWAGAPFGATDFSEFLPLLTGHPDFGSRLAAFVRHYADEGRFNLLQYVALSLKWSLLSDDTAAWQLVRAGQMLILVAGVYILMRRLGASAWGAAGGASLLCVSRAATSAWTRLTMGEPLATLCILGAALLAVRYRQQTRYRSAASGIALLVAAAILTKELFIGAIPLVLSIACCYEGDGTWVRPEWRSTRLWTLFGVVGATVLACAVPILWAATHVRAEGFTSAYGQQGLGLERVADILTVLLLPWPQSPLDRWRAIIGVPNLVLAATFAPLVSLARRDPVRLRAVLVAAVLPVIAFATLYAPWGSMLPFYALPTLLGGAFLVAAGLDELRGWSTRWSRVFAVMWVMGIMVSLQLSYAWTVIGRALREAEGEAATAIVARSEVGGIAIAMQHPLNNSLTWRRRGPTLVRYAMVLAGRQRPIAQEISCATVSDRGAVTPTAGLTLIVVYSDECGAPPVSDATVRRLYRLPSLLPFGIVTDSVRLDLVLLEPSNGRGTSTTLGRTNSMTLVTGYASAGHR